MSLADARTSSGACLADLTGSLAGVGALPGAAGTMRASRTGASCSPPHPDAPGMGAYYALGKPRSKMTEDKRWQPN
jgi:hypothetical protein